MRSPFAYAILPLAITAACGSSVAPNDDSATAAGTGGAGADAGGSDDVVSSGVGGTGGVPAAGAGGGATLHTCWRLFSGSKMGYLELETGYGAAYAPVPPGFAPAGLPHPPIAYQGAVYDCSVGLLTRNDLYRNEIEVSDVPCAALAFDNDFEGLVVASEDQVLTRFASWSDALLGSGEQYTLSGYPIDVMGFDGDVAYFAGQSGGGVVERYSLAAASGLDPLFLDGVTGLTGLDATTDGWLVVDSGEDTVLVFDASSGTPIFDVYAPTEPAAGLTCQVGALR